MLNLWIKQRLANERGDACIGARATDAGEVECVVDGVVLAAVDVSPWARRPNILHGVWMLPKHLDVVSAWGVMRIEDKVDA